MNVNWVSAPCLTVIKTHYSDPLAVSCVYLCIKVLHQNLQNETDTLEKKTCQINWFLNVAKILYSASQLYVCWKTWLNFLVFIIYLILLLFAWHNTQPWRFSQIHVRLPCYQRLRDTFAKILCLCVNIHCCARLRLNTIYNHRIRLIWSAAAEV